jgi:hypothetical protein
MYWKGLEPSELPEFDSRLVAQSTLQRIDPGSRKISTTLLNFISHHSIDALQRRP